MKRKTLITLLIAIAFGLVTAKVGSDLLNAREKGGGDTPLVKVVVAQRDLQPGELLAESDLALATVPAEMAGKTSFRDVKPLAGRALLSPVVKGQTLFEALLAAPGAPGGFQAIVPEGKRAITLDTGDSSSAGLITPGCRVDVIATLRKGDRTLARTIVENVRVSAVDGKTVRLDQTDDKRGPHNVTLLVTPQQAEAIELASNSAKPRLVLRGANDHSSYDSSGVSSSALLGEPEEPEKPEPPAQPAAVVAPPATQPAVAVAPPEPSRRSVQFIRRGIESTAYIDLDTGEVDESGARSTAPLSSDAAGGGSLLKNKRKGS